MAKLYYAVGTATAEAVRPDDKLLVALPETRRIVIMPTYANQISPGHRVAMKLGEPGMVAAYLAEAVLPGMRARAEKEQAEAQLQLESLEEKLATLNSSATKRAQLFLDYVWSGGRFGGDLHRVRQNVVDGNRLSSQDLTALVSAVYNMLRAEHDASSAVKEQVRKYVSDGVADEKALSLFEAAVNPVFGSLMRYFELKDQQQRAVEKAQQTAGDLSTLEQALVQAVEAIKSGADAQTNFQFNGFEVNIQEALQQLAGNREGNSYNYNGSHFLCLVTGVRTGRSDGAFVPFVYKGVNVQSLPEELRQRFLPTQRLVQMIKILEMPLFMALDAYVHADPSWESYKGLPINLGLLTRRLRPQNPAFRALYTDARITINNDKALTDEVAEKLCADYRNGSVAKLATAQLKLSEDELNQEGLERLVSLLDKIMPVLPFDIYEHIVLSFAIKALQTRLRAITHTPHAPNQSRAYQFLINQHKVMRTRYDGLSSKLRDGFGVNVNTMLDHNELVIEETIALFGEELGFIRAVLAKGASAV